MHKGRLEAFSDGVMAVIITIMVLEFKLPKGNTLQDLIPLLPTLISYIISFVFIGIYWNNHHHMFQLVEKVNGKTLWANHHLLFWLSLIPFVTNWMNDNSFSKWPVILYGFILLLCGVAYYILSKALLKASSENERLERALGQDQKGILSMVIYLIGIGLGFVNPLFSLACYVTVAIIWFIPDKRVEKVVFSEEKER